MIKVLFIGRRHVSCLYARFVETVLKEKSLESDWVIVEDPSLGVRFSGGETFHLIVVDEHALQEISAADYVAQLTKSDTCQVIVITNQAEVAGAEFVFQHSIEQEDQEAAVRSLLQLVFNALGI